MVFKVNDEVNNIDTIYSSKLINMYMLVFLLNKISIKRR